MSENNGKRVEPSSDWNKIVEDRKKGSWFRGKAANGKPKFTSRSDGADGFERAPNPGE